MGFKINVNTILRHDPTEVLEVGREYPFEKEGLYLLADEIQIWLTKNDWTVLADIQITSQQRKDNKTSGTFLVKYLYVDNEQQMQTEVFRRMYGWE